MSPAGGRSSALLAARDAASGAPACRRTGLPPVSAPVSKALEPAPSHGRASRPAHPLTHQQPRLSPAWPQSLGGHWSPDSFTFRRSGGNAGSSPYGFNPRFFETNGAGRSPRTGRGGRPSSLSRGLLAESRGRRTDSGTVLSKTKGPRKLSPFVTCCHFLNFLFKSQGSESW